MKDTKKVDFSDFNIKITRRNFLSSILASPLLFYGCVSKKSNRWKWDELSQDAKNNLHCVDLSDLKEDLPLDIKSRKVILEITEDWERGYEGFPYDDSFFGYPTVVRNIHGPNPDYKYYLFYAHHMVGSCIGVAISDNIEGPYIKLKDIDKKRKNSCVLCPPNPSPENLFHYSTPVVVWNEEKQAWFMYFHYYKNEFDIGKGHQKTALAICKDLSTHIWEPLTDESGNLIPVLPTTRERWMNSQSSYHAIQRLPNGTWLAFLRGTGGSYEVAQGKKIWVQDPCALGFATSNDGIHWNYFPENPIIHQKDGGGGRDGVYKPRFVGFLGNDEYLLCWSESRYYDKDPRIIYGKTSDFKHIKRDKRGYAKFIPKYDGIITPWREGKYLYLFTGKELLTMELPV
ncbi:MAG: hypothetical protein JHC31_07220 [Sulfurihydrogenibium sp.]|jgi:hypothetical protein|nr:hypothetical protein [Sulfurihydrogenibium sp.]